MTMATWRRLWPSNRPKMVSRTRPGRPGRFAQSTRHSVIAQPPGPHVIARAGTKRARWVGADPDRIRAIRPAGPDTKRPPVARRSRRDLGRPAGAGRSLPALPRLENECRAGEGGQDQRAPGRPEPSACESSLTTSAVPAPIVRAIDARSARAQVKRTRFAFTSTPLSLSRASGPGNRAVFRGRSLALRPRLATGLPWTVSRWRSTCPSRPTMGGSSRAEHGTKVRVTRGRWGSCRPAPARRVGSGAVTAGFRPARRSSGPAGVDERAGRDASRRPGARTRRPRGGCRRR